jgi:hypothetical protein
VAIRLGRKLAFDWRAKCEVRTKIFVQLLNEGTDCWRPADAKEHGDGVFEILGIMPAGEEWQFVPGTRVRCRQQQFADGPKALVANELVIDKP